MSGQLWIALAVGLVAAAEDVARRRVSNWIPVAAVAAGTSWSVFERGWRGLGSSVAGVAAGFVVFLVFYLLGGMGGGDVKLMAGFGAVLGLERLLEAALWTAGVGGLIALGAIALESWKRWRGQPQGGEQGKSIPYAPAIALGAWLSLVPKG